MQTDLQKKIKELQRKIARKITYFQTGGVRPRGAIDECWIGCVLAYAADEKLPVDKNGAPMLPLAQFYLSALPYVPHRSWTASSCLRSLSHRISSVNLMRIWTACGRSASIKTRRSSS